MHCKAGHPWSPDLGVAQKEAARSLLRGIGPARAAATVRLEDTLLRPSVVERIDRRGPPRPTDMLIISSLWLLRGAEAAALLGEQAWVDERTGSATLELGATKTNPAGKECERTLRCSYERGEGQSLGTRACPVHALKRVLAWRTEAGFGGKHPLFPSCDGLTVMSRGVVNTLRRIADANSLSEHSMRRTGAQHYARHGVPLALIQFLGRWGGPTVERYVGEALIERASWASVASVAPTIESGFEFGAGVVVADGGGPRCAH